MLQGLRVALIKFRNFQILEISKIPTTFFAFSWKSAAGALRARRGRFSKEKNMIFQWLPWALRRCSVLLLSTFYCDVGVGGYFYHIQGF